MLPHINAGLISATHGKYYVLEQMRRPISINGLRGFVAIRPNNTATSQALESQGTGAY